MKAASIIAGLLPKTIVAAAARLFLDKAAEATGPVHMTFSSAERAFFDPEKAAVDQRIESIAGTVKESVLSREAFEKWCVERVEHLGERIRVLESHDPVLGLAAIGYGASAESSTAPRRHKKPGKRR